MEDQDLYEGQKRLEDGFCPKCDYPLAHESSCLVCYQCGWSMCS